LLKPSRSAGPSTGFFIARTDVVAKPETEQFSVNRLGPGAWPQTKRGQIPEACVPILERLECSAETWLDFVQNFRQRFRSEASLASSRQAYRNRRRSAQPAFHAA